MRCPDCNKFVGLENGEPEVNSVDCEWQDDGAGSGSFSLNVEARAIRNCAECGQELKSADLQMEGEASLEDCEAWLALPVAEKAEVIAALNDGSAEVDAHDNGENNSEDGGGSRYAKNIITTVVGVEVVIEVNLKDGKAVKLALYAQVSEGVAASGYEECV